MPAFITIKTFSKGFIAIHCNVTVYFETDVMRNSALSVNEVEVKVEVQGFHFPSLSSFLSGMLKVPTLTLSLFLMISCFRQLHACLQKFCITFKWSFSFE